MANTVDRRIVEMRFDNKQFEQGIKTTMSMLDKLKQALTFKNSKQGFEEISQAAKNVSLDAMASSIDTIANRFTTMGIVGVTALQNITNSAINAGMNLVRSLTIEPVMTGLQEYELKMDSIQTILANTSRHGSTLEDVSNALDELNLYADKTIYNFAQMTQAIGTFTTAGVNLENATASVKGIANLAAFVGAPAQDASRAMFQLAQSLGNGVVRLQDWMSLEHTAGMGGIEFQDRLKETARVLGTGVDAAIEKNGSFRESLKEDWLTTEVLVETLKQFANEVDATTLAAQGFSEDQIASILNLGATAEQSATRVKTLSQLLETMGESVQSGWASTWEFIIGDLDEAASLFTAINNGFEKIVGASAEARNSMLQVWHDNGGRDALLKGLKRISVGFWDIYYITRGVWQEMFPPMTGEKLIKLTKQFRDLFKGFTFSEEAAEGLRVVLRLLLLPLKGISLVVGGMAKTFIFVAKKVVQLTNLLLEFIGSISLGVGGIGKFITASKNWERITSSLYKIIKNLGGAFYYAFGTITKFFTSLISPISIRGVGVDLEWITSKLEAFRDISLDAIATALENISNLTFSDVKNFFGGIIDGFMNFVGYVKEIPFVQGVLEKVAPILDKVSENLQDFKINAIEAGKGAIEFFKSLKNYKFSFEGFGWLDVIKEKLVEVKNKFIEFKDGLDISGKIDVVKNSITKFTEALKDFFSTLDLSVIGVVGFGAAVVYTMIKVGQGISSIGGFFDSASDMVGGITDAISSFGKEEETKSDAFVKIAKAIAILAGSLALLASVDSKKLVTAAITLGALTAALVLIAGVVSVLEKFEKIGNIGGIAKPLIMMAGAMAVLTGALAILANIPDDNLNSLFVKAGILASLMGAMGLIAAGISRIAPNLSKGSVFLFMFSLSAVKIVDALMVLAEADNEKIAKAIPNMFKMMISLGALAALVGKMKFGSAAGVVLLVLSLTLMQKAIQKIAEGDVDLNTVRDNISKFITIFGGIALLMASTALAGKNAAKGGVAILFVSAALHLVMSAIKKIIEIDPLSLTKGLVAVTEIFAVFAGVMAASHLAGKNAVKAAAAIAILSVVSLVIVQVIKQLGKIDEKVLVKGIAAMTAVAALFAALMYATSFTKGASTGSIIALTASIGILMVGLGLLTTLDTGKLMVSAIAIAAVVAAFGGALYAAGQIDSDEGFKTMLVMLISLAASAASLYILAQLPWQGVIAAGVALASVMISLGAATKLAQDNMEGAKAMLVMCASLAIAAASLYFLAEQDWEGLLAGGVALGLLMLAVGASLKIADSSLTGAAAMLVASVSIIALAGALRIVGEMDRDSIINALIGIAGGLLAMVVAVIAISGTGPVGIVVLLALAAAFVSIGASALMLGIGAKLFLEAVVSFISGLQALARDGNMTAKDLGYWIMKGLIDGIKGMVNALVETFLGIFQNVVGKVKGFLGINSPSRVFSYIGQMCGQGLGEGMGDSSEFVSMAAQSLSGSALDGLGDMSSLFSGAGQNAVAGLVGSFYDNDQQLIDAAGNVNEKLSGSLLQIVSGGEIVGTGYVDNIATGMINERGRLLNATEELHDVMAESYSIDPDRFPNEGEMAAEGYASGYTSALYDADLGSMTTDDFTQFMQENMGQYETCGSDSIVSLMTGMENKTPEIENLVNEMGQNNVDALDQYTPEYTTIGENAGQGFIDGLKSKMEEAAKTAAEMAKAAVEAASAELDINSPSRVFNRIGRYSGEGFVRGLMTYTAESNYAGKAVADAAVESMTNAISKISDTIDREIDSTPMITPILDLSNVTKGSGQIEAMFSRNQAIIAAREYNDGKVANVNMDIQNMQKLNAQNMNYMRELAKAVQSSNGQPVTVQVNLEGDAKQLFKVVRNENDKFTTSTHYNPLARMREVRG